MVQFADDIKLVCFGG